MNTEPATIIGFLTALVSAVLVFLRAFGFDVTSAQQDAIRGIVAVVAPLLAALVIRSFVVSPQTAKDKVVEAHAAGAAGAPVPSVKA